MEQGTVLGLAALLWPLLAAFVWWTFRLPPRERTRSLRVLGTGAVAGMALVTLLAAPALLRAESARPLFLLFSGSRIWMEYAVAVPLGALIALLLAQTAEPTA